MDPDRGGNGQEIVSYRGILGPFGHRFGREATPCLGKPSRLVSAIKTLYGKPLINRLTASCRGGSAKPDGSISNPGMAVCGIPATVPQQDARGARIAWKRCGFFAYVGNRKVGVEQWQ